MQRKSLRPYFGSKIVYNFVETVFFAEATMFKRRFSALKDIPMWFFSDSDKELQKISVVTKKSWGN